jgi:hypothetical protein
MAISLKEALEAMDYDELMKVKIELESGGFNMKRLVLQKVREKEKKHEMRCTVCSSDVNPFSSNNYTLLFGPEDFKKKATFCALDCMEYFINHLRQTKGYRKKPEPPI